MIVETIKTEMKAQRATQKNLAEYCKVDPSTLCGMGKRNTTLTTIEAIMDYLHLEFAPKSGFVFHSDFLANKMAARKTKYA